MDSNSVLAAATVVLAVGTLVLVGITAYYAWQNHNMVDVLRRQSDLTEQIERDRRADSQIMAAALLEVRGPTYDRGTRTVDVPVKNLDASPILAARLVLRAAKDPVGPPAWEAPTGATEAAVEMTNALMPDQTWHLNCHADDFFRPGDIHPGESPLWHDQLIFDVESVGLLGQKVLQRYEWGPGESGRQPYIRLRIVQITPSVEGSKPLRYVASTASA